MGSKSGGHSNIIIEEKKHREALAKYETAKNNLQPYIPNEDKSKKINRFRNSEGIDYLTSGVGYVFMTKPHLNLLMNEKNNGDAFLYNLAKGSSETARNIVNDLDGMTGKGKECTFIKMITNSVESFDTKDIVLKTKEIGENFQGEKLHWGGNYFESMGGDNISIEYTEYSDLSLTLLHKAWVDYIHGVKLNKIKPYSKLRDGVSKYDYIENKIIDYAVSIYYFLLDVDGTTIKYYAKYTGVFPTSVPYSAMSFKLGENAPKKLSIQYQYSFKEDMDPRILDEFYYLTKSEGVAEPKEEPNIRKNWVDKVYISRDRKRIFFR